MRVVTTCNEAGFKEYGFRVIDGWHHWPRDAELHWYVEGFDLPETEGIKQKSVEYIHQLANLKRRYSSYIPPSYMWDVVRYAHKVFAAVDGFRNYGGIGVWMDADCVTFKDIPAGFFEEQLGRSYIAIFNRTSYTETGLWIVDCSHDLHQEFMETWASWYESDAFSTIPGGWTDCHTLDATIRKFKDAITVTNLSGDHADDIHPMSYSRIGEYIDHCKGPRKASGISPENPNRTTT